MKKQQRRERALLLLVYAMLQEGFRIIDIDPNKVGLERFEDVLDMKVVMLYKKMSKIVRTLGSKKITNFLDQRLATVDDSIEKECQPFYIGILIYYFHLLNVEKKDFIFTDLKKKDIEDIVEEHNKEFGISDCTLNKSIDLYCSIYPQQKGYIEFRKITNKFPFDIIKQKKEI